MSKKVITSEFVAHGHPDKVADMISDALLDEYIRGDKNSRVAIETMIKDNIIVVGGEIKSKANIDVEKTIRSTMNKIHYPESHNLNGDSVKIINLIGKQSVEISKGVDKEGHECIGAGDQGFCVGFASNETRCYIPLGVYMAKQICQNVVKISGYGPDAKTQVTVEYDDDNKARVTSIVVSVMHSKVIPLNEVRETITEMINTNVYSDYHVMDDELHFEYIKNKDIKLYINQNGKWNVGGPISDCGVTGRKLAVDQYGGYCNVSGGALSGKDMSKIDRSGNYMARYLAKNIVDAGLADEAKVILSYVISEPNPIAVSVELNRPRSTNSIRDLEVQIRKFIIENIDLTPNGIIKRFFPNGTIPIFYDTARFGHFGYNDMSSYPWENTDISDKMREYINDIEISL